MVFKKSYVLLVLTIATAPTVVAADCVRQLPKKPISKQVREHAQQASHKKKPKKKPKKQKKTDLFQEALKDRECDEDGNNLVLASILRELHEAQNRLIKKNRELEEVVIQLAEVQQGHELLLNALISKMEEQGDAHSSGTDQQDSLDQLQGLLGLAR